MKKLEGGQLRSQNRKQAKPLQMLTIVAFGCLAVSQLWSSSHYHLRQTSQCHHNSPSKLGNLSERRWQDISPLRRPNHGPRPKHCNLRPCQHHHLQARHHPNPSIANTSRNFQTEKNLLVPQCNPCMARRRLSKCDNPPAAV